MTDGDYCRSLTPSLVLRAPTLSAVPQLSAFPAPRVWGQPGIGNFCLIWAPN